ncbi:MAG: 30S ribosomal protein S18 [Clostridia bacterium]|nr:30S ribosomal protein S18 [Clostridia bacterium]
MENENTNVTAPVENAAPAREQREPRDRDSFKKKPRKKVCQFCADKVDCIDYKDVAKLRRFISERGKILPRRITATCAMHQRELTEAIKRARQIAILPYTND